MNPADYRCRFERVDGKNVWRCSACGFTVRAVAPLPHNCPERSDALAIELRELTADLEGDAIDVRRAVDVEIRTPNNITRLIHWRAALKKWRRAGEPLRPPTQRVACHAVCQVCPSGLFDPDRGLCKACGCNVGPSRFVTLDKAALATEDCDRRHWPR